MRTERYRVQVCAWETKKSRDEQRNTERCLLNSCLRAADNAIYCTLNERMKTILVLSWFYHPFIGGAEIFVRAVSERLRGRYRFNIVTARINKRLPNTEKADGITIHRVGGGRPSDKFIYPLSALRQALRLESVDLVGSSQGGWFTLNFAVAFPERVTKLALLAPAASFRPFRRAAKLSLRIGPHMPGWTAGPSLRPVFGDRHRVDPRLVDLLSISLDQYRVQQNPVFPEVFSDDELRSVSAETLVLIGDQEIIYDPTDALKRADSLIPSVHTELVDNAGHLLNIEHPDLINEKVLALLGG